MLYSILGHEVSNITLLIEIDYLTERKKKTFVSFFIKQTFHSGLYLIHA
jgi:hypothetical protein